MTQSSFKPVIFLAFANDLVDGLSYLRNLAAEARRVRQTLETAEQANLCEIVVRQNASLADVLDVFQSAQYRNRISIFHFGGHANGYQLLLQDNEGNVELAGAAGVAGFLGQQRGLELVFLNGCSTAAQTDDLLDAGVSCVISTAQAINDKVATDFATRFYQGLASGATIQTSFSEAEAAAKASLDGQMRGAYIDGLKDEELAAVVSYWPWSVRTRPGANVATTWNLPDSANNPLFSLPPLPDMDLPNRPFRNLHWFRREDAHLFFGRGYEIRNLFEQVVNPRTPPIVLFYGQSGVGKSSLLAAGLLPRLEISHAIEYMRRDADAGLLGALASALAIASESGDLSAKACRGAWLAKEEKLARPLVIIIDQVEEVFTRPNEQRQDELTRFLDTLAGIYADRDQRPVGKLILGFRKEWLAEIERQSDEARLPTAKVFLQRLERSGIMQAVSGITSTELLRTKYRLTISDELPGLIADDLLEDPLSAIAPTLQVLMTKLWNQATERSRDAPHFNETLYQSLKRQGILLKDFLDQQLIALAEWNRDVVDSGLALDLLAFHTTALGTAEERAKSELERSYHHQQSILVDLIQHFKDEFLLVEPDEEQKQQAGDSRLAHDALAPLVRERYEHSNLPGQRAKRILESRVTERYQESVEETRLDPLDPLDLAVVEAGQPGMRAWTERELKLIELSRQERARGQRLRRTLRIVGTAAVVLITSISVFAWYQWGQAEDNLALSLIKEAEANEAQAKAEANEAEARRQRDRADVEAEAALRNEQEALDSKQRAEVEQLKAENNARRFRARDLLSAAEVVLARNAFDPSLPVMLALEAIQTGLDENGEVEPFVTENLWNITEQVQRIGWRQNLPHWQHVQEVHAASFTPDGDILTAGQDQTARLWDAKTGEQLRLFIGHNGRVFDARVSPDGKTMATTGDDGTVRIWDVDTGEQLLRWQAHCQRARTVDFHPNGDQIVSASQDETARIWNLSSVESQLEAGLAAENDDCVLLTPDQELVHDGGWILAAKFSPNGSKLVTTGGDSNARLWDAQTGEQIARLSHIDDNWGWQLAFTQDGERLISAHADGTVTVWQVNDGRKSKPFDQPHQFEEDDKQREIRSLTVNRANDVALTVDASGLYVLWDVTTGEQMSNTIGSDEPVLLATMSPDGNQIATVHQDNSIRVRERYSGEMLQELIGHAGTVNHLSFSQDGKWLLTASSDRTARLWNLESGEELLVIDGHDEAVMDARFSPNGMVIATAGADGTVKLWDTQTGAQISAWSFHTDLIHTVEFNADGRLLLTASDDGTAVLWDVAAEKELAHFAHDGQAVLVARFSPDGELIATSGADSRIRLWHAGTAEQIRMLRPFDERWARQVAFSPDGTRFATVAARGRVHIWDGESGEELARLAEHGGQVNNVVFGSDGDYLVTAANDGELFKWDLATEKVSQKFEGHQRSVLAADISPDQQQLVSAGSDSTVRLWRVEDGEQIRAIDNLPFDKDDKPIGIKSVAFSPDGEFIAAADDEGLLRLWNVAAGTEISGLEAHTDAIRSLVFSPEGDLLVTASEDASAQIWDVTTMSPITRLLGYTDTIESVAFSTDGSLVLTAGKPDRVSLWDVATGNEIQAFVGHTDTVRVAVFGVDDRTILSGGDDDAARLWDTQTGEELALFSTESTPVRAAAVSPAEPIIAIGTRDGTILLWDLETEINFFTILGHQDSIRSLEFSLDGKSLLSAGEDNTARLWEVETGREIQLLVGHAETINKEIFGAKVNHATFGQRDKMIATAGQDGIVKLWETGARTGRRSFAAHGLVRFAAFNKDDTLVVTVGEDRRARVWDAQTAEELIHFEHAEEAVWSAIFSPQEQYLLTAGQDGTIRLWSLKSKEQLRADWEAARADEEVDDEIAVTQEVISATIGAKVNFAGFSPDGKFIITASANNKAQLWQWSEELITVTREYVGHEGGVLQADINPNGTLLATSSEDTSIRLWDVDSGREMHEMRGHGSWVWFVDFSPDGSRLATAGGDGTARVWDVESGNELLILSGHTSLVRTAQFSPDGKMILTAGEDKTARLWDAATGAELRQFTGHTDDVWYAGFSHDGKFIATTSFDGTVRLWDTHLEDSLNRARALIQRNPPVFNEEEKEEYEIGR